MEINSNALGSDSGSNAYSDQNNIGNNTSTNTDKTIIKLQVWAISYEYYQYLLSKQNQPDLPNSDNNISTIFSNIEGGTGIFGGYNLKELYFEID